MMISSIVAVSENNVIGMDNDLPWHLPNDLQYFKRRTLGHPILMGRNTYESIGRPLPKRENIIISRNAQYAVEGAVVKSSISKALAYCEAQQYDEIFFIGGAEIYKQCLAISNKLYITKVHTTIENGTAFFPELNWDEWTLTEKEFFAQDEKNNFDHTFETYLRTS